MIDSERDFFLFSQRAQPAAVGGGERERLFHEGGDAGIDDLFRRFRVNMGRGQHMNAIGDAGGQHVVERTEHVLCAAAVGEPLGGPARQIAHRRNLDALDPAQRVRMPFGDISGAKQRRPDRLHSHVCPLTAFICIPRCRSCGRSFSCAGSRAFPQDWEISTG